MDIAALVLWIVTAGVGFYLLGTWITKGGTRRDAARSRFPRGVIFGHFLLAALGLVLWIVFVATASRATGWADLGVIVVVALLGFTMFARWIPTYRASRGALVSAHAGASTTEPSGDTSSAAGPAERHFPVTMVLGHGLLAATTLVLVIIALA